MDWRIWILFSVVLSAVLQAPATHRVDAHHAPALSWANPLIEACPTHDAQRSPPDFSAPDCLSTSMLGLEPIGGSTWVRITFPAWERRSGMDEALGISLIGHSARTYIFNGKPIGATGVPGATRADETPGVLRDVVYVPRAYLREGTQELVLFMSCHHRRDANARCLESAYLGPYEAIKSQGVQEGISSLVVFSGLIVGAVLFASLAIRGSDPVGSTYLSLLCASAYFLSILNSLHFMPAFAYTVEDVRLSLVALFSFLVGISCAGYVLGKLTVRTGFAILAISSVFAFIGMATATDPQLASRYAIAVPMITAAVFAVGWAMTGRRHALEYATLTCLMILVMALQDGAFLVDSAVYSAMGVLTFLFVKRTGVLEQTSDLKAKSEEMERALKSVQARLTTTTKSKPDASVDDEVMVKLSDRAGYVRANTISHCNGARDYVEICFVDGKEVLHSGSLAELEKAMPGSFVRVHRSHIVNTYQIQSARRLANGGGALLMRNGKEIAVSRRIMPSIKELLDEGGIAMSGQT